MLLICVDSVAMLKFIVGQCQGPVTLRLALKPHLDDRVIQLAKLCFYIRSGVIKSVLHPHPPKIDHPINDID